MINEKLLLINQITVLLTKFDKDTLKAIYRTLSRIKCKNKLHIDKNEQMFDNIRGESEEGAIIGRVTK